ncbi:MAG: DMT family transporter [Deltaproteobacteria bacterium]|nr:DMT family transporter [Deltaproteobacteria bacterium]
MIGITCSIGAAFLWASALVLFKKSGETISPLALNIFKCTVTLALLTPTLLLFNIELFPDRPMSDWLIFSLSGIFGITLADTFFFMALSRLGAGMTAVVDCLYLPMILFFSFIFLDEVLGVKGLCGAGLVIGAVIISSAARPVATVSRKNLIQGIVLGILAVSLLAGSIIMIKYRLKEVSVLWASFVRILAGTAGLYLLAILHSDKKSLLAELYPSKSWKTALPASIIGNYMAMIAWLAGIKYILVSVAAVLNQLSAIFIFILAAIFLKEPVTLPRLSATLLAVSGAIIVATTVN